MHSLPGWRRCRRWWRRWTQTRGVDAAAAAAAAAVNDWHKHLGPVTCRRGRLTLNRRGIIRTGNREPNIRWPRHHCRVCVNVPSVTTARCRASYRVIKHSLLLCDLLTVTSDDYLIAASALSLHVKPMTDNDVVVSASVKNCPLWKAFSLAEISDCHPSTLPSRDGCCRRLLAVSRRFPTNVSEWKRVLNNKRKKKQKRLWTLMPMGFPEVFYCLRSGVFVCWLSFLTLYVKHWTKAVTGVW